MTSFSVFATVGSGEAVAISSSRMKTATDPSTDAR